MRAARGSSAACVALLLALCGGCGGANDAAVPIAAPEQRPYSPGTVLAIGEREVSAAEVDRVAKWIEQLYPQSADAHNRRRALTSVLLPRIALAEAHRAAHGEALARARGARAELVAGRTPAELTVREATGTWGPLGIEIFGPAHELALDTWSEPLEGLGRLVLVRVREKSGGPELCALVLRVEIAEFPFVPAGSTQESIDRDIDTQTLVLVDAAWEQYVPLAWQHRLHGYLRNMK